MSGRASERAASERLEKEGLFNAFLPVYQGGQTDGLIGGEDDGQAEQKVERAGKTREGGGSARASSFRRRVIEGVIYVVIQSIRRRLIPSPSWPPIPLVSLVMTRSTRGSCTHVDPRGAL